MYLYLLSYSHHNLIHITLSPGKYKYMCIPIFLKSKISNLKNQLYIVKINIK